MFFSVANNPKFGCDSSIGRHLFHENCYEYKQQKSFKKRLEPNTMSGCIVILPVKLLRTK